MTPAERLTELEPNTPHLAANLRKLDPAYLTQLLTTDPKESK